MSDISVRREAVRRIAHLVAEFRREELEARRHNVASSLDAFTDEQGDDIMREMNRIVREGIVATDGS